MAMPLSRQKNPTLAKPHIKVLSRHGIEDCFTVRMPKGKGIFNAYMLAYNALLKYPIYFSYPVRFSALIGNIREFIIPKKTSKNISGNVPYIFVTGVTSFYYSKEDLKLQ
ncbi:hypothetical protein TNCV_3904571 [Trichonephila clavipes]|nr:hypothetical protein TNCV_3904571 [Trichonephila clavipes]